MASKKSGSLFYGLNFFELTCKALKQKFVTYMAFRPFLLAFTVRSPVSDTRNIQNTLSFLSIQQIVLSTRLGKKKAKRRELRRWMRD